MADLHCFMAEISTTFKAIFHWEDPEGSGGEGGGRGDWDGEHM